MKNVSYLKQALIPVKNLVMWITALSLLSCGGGDGDSDEKDVLIPVAAADTYVYVNNRGEVFTPEVNVPETSAFYGNYAVVGKEKKGFLDKRGKLIIPMQYAEATIFSDGLAFVRETAKSAVIAIDTKGKEVFRLPPDVTNARRFSEGFAAFFDQKKGLWGYIDKTGKVVIEPQYKESGDFSCGLATAGSRNAYGFIDAKGKVVIEPQFVEQRWLGKGIWNQRFTADGYCIVGIGDRYGQQFGVINTKGEFVIPLMECYIQADKDGFIARFTNYKGKREAIYLDVKGKTKLSGFSELYPFNGGKYTVAVPIDDEEFVIIDREGKTVSKIEFSFSRFRSSFIDGMAVAQNEGYYVSDGQSIINVKGQKVIDTEKVFVADDYGMESELLYFSLNINQHMY